MPGELAMRRSWWILLGMLFLVSKGAARAARKEANEAPPHAPVRGADFLV